MRVECTEIIFTDSWPPTSGIRYRVVNRASGLEVDVYDAQTDGNVIAQPLSSQARGRMEFWAEEATYHTIESEDGEFPDFPWLAPPTTGGGGAGEVTQAEFDAHLGAEAAENAEFDTHAALEVGMHGVPDPVAVGQGIRRTADGWEATTIAGSGTVNTVDCAILVDPIGDDENGVVVKIPSDEWGTGDYGTGQAFMVLKEGTSGTQPDDQVLYRVTNTGGFGAAGGAHFATGLRQRPGFVANQSIWIDPYMECTGIVVDSFDETPSVPWQQWRLGGGTVICEIDSTGLLKANRNIQINTSGTGSTASLILGRGTTAQEGQIGIAAAADQLADDTSVGDMVIRSLLSSGEVMIRAGTNQDAPIRVGSGKLGFYGNTPQAQPEVGGSRGGNAALLQLLGELHFLGLITDNTVA